MARVRTKLVTVRIAETTLLEFKAAAELRGAGMSGLLHQYIVKTIREEKERSPEQFERKIAEILAKEEKESPTITLAESTSTKRRKAS